MTTNMETRDEAYRPTSERALIEECTGPIPEDGEHNLPHDLAILMHRNNRLLAAILAKLR